MIALVFWVCAMGAPWHCQAVQLVFASDGDGRAVTPMMCLMHGQAEIARWLDTHPGFRRHGPYSCMAASRRRRADARFAPEGAAGGTNR
jgi:hypothetical protein